MLLITLSHSTWIAVRRGSQKCRVAPRLHASDEPREPSRFPVALQHLCHRGTSWGGFGLLSARSSYKPPALCWRKHRLHDRDPRYRPLPARPARPVAGPANRRSAEPGHRFSVLRKLIRPEQIPSDSQPFVLQPIVARAGTSMPERACSLPLLTPHGRRSRFDDVYFKSPNA